MDPLTAALLVGGTALSTYLFQKFGVKEVFATTLPKWMSTPFFGRGGFTDNTKRFRTNELIFSCINKTGNAASQINLLVRDRNSKILLKDHPLQKLLRKPNRFMSEFDLWYTVIMLQMLSGRAVLEKERNNAGEVIGLWPLRPDWLKVVPSDTRLIAGFYFGPSADNRVFIPYEDTVDLPLNDPNMPIIPFDPIAPATVAARITETDSTITDFVKLVFDKGGVPPGLLKTKQKLMDTQVKILRRRWRERYGGMQNWLEPAILDSDAEYQRMGMTMKEMGFDFLDRRNESRVCMVLDIPPIVVGAYVGIELSSYDNYLTARSAWWQDSLIPRFVNTRDRIFTELAPEYTDGERLELFLNLDNVYALQDDIEKVWGRSLNAVRAGVFTVNMALQEMGKNPIGSQGDVFLRPLSNETVPMRKSIESMVNQTLLELEEKTEPDDPKKIAHEREMVDITKESLEEVFGDLKDRIESDGPQAILAE